MSIPETPEERATKLVTTMAKVPGGSWFVRLGEVIEPPAFLGPYENPAVAREDAKKVAQFIAAVICEIRPTPCHSNSS